MDIRKGFFNKAGSACHKQCRFEEQKQQVSPFTNPEVLKKAKETNLKRYGTEYACQNKDVARKLSEGRKKSQSKIEQTNIEKYGVKNVFQSEEIKQKIRETNVEKYGTDHPMKSKEIQEKTKNTLIKKYGVSNLMKSEFIKEKSKETNREKYGCDNPMQNGNVREKSKNTMVARYGVEYPFQSQEIYQKMIDSTVKKYGVEKPLQNAEIKNRVIKKFKKAVEENHDDNFRLSNALRGELFWEKMKGGFSLKELSVFFQIQMNSLGSRLLNGEFKEKYYLNYMFPKQQTQKKIKAHLESLGFFCEFNNRKAISPLELDIFIPLHNFAIEFNGSYWHSEAILPSQISRNKHYNKTKLCREKGIRLFHIFENNWNLRKNQIMNFIKSILGKNSDRIMARKCELDYSRCPDFIENNHIQGPPNHALKYFNLIYKNEIIASITASRHHRQNAQGNPVVLSRLCFKDGTTVQGGSSKLFKQMIIWVKNQGYDRIISWSDNSWTEGGIYRTLGFELKKEYGPDYFYWDMKNNRYLSKQSQRKDLTGCPKEITERDWCYQKGLYRIWDCGKKMWEYKI